MCVNHFYKRAGPPIPLLTFWLTMVGNIFQSKIPTIDAHLVAGSLNTTVVELFVLVDLPPADLGHLQ